MAEHMNEGESVLYHDHPAMFRNHPVGFVLAVILAPAVVGLIILLIWWLRSIGTTLTVTNEQSTLRLGVFSKRTVDVYHDDVRMVELNQTVSQRIFGTGTITIASAGTGGAEIVVSGLPDPEKVKAIIDQHRRR